MGAELSKQIGSDSLDQIDGEKLICSLSAHFDSLVLGKGTGSAAGAAAAGAAVTYFEGPAAEAAPGAGGGDPCTHCCSAV